jgi:hypothetical protein
LISFVEVLLLVVFTIKMVETINLLQQDGGGVQLAAAAAAAHKRR